MAQKIPYDDDVEALHIPENTNRAVKWIQMIPHKEQTFDSPVNIDINAMEKISLPSLLWHNYKDSPKKLKLTNTGHTLILSGKWEKERPYLNAGPLSSKYVFSQLHFHWGIDESEGSEHTVDGRQYPLEMHVVHFKSSYLSQEHALKEKDGICVLAYFFMIQNKPNPAIQPLVEAIPNIRQCHMSENLALDPLYHLVRPFNNDFFMYWGSVSTSSCLHVLLWLLSREPIGISMDQMSAFRSLLDQYNDPLVRNYRSVQTSKKPRMFHVNPKRHESLLVPETRLNLAQPSLYDIQKKRQMFD